MTKIASRGSCLKSLLASEKLATESCRRADRLTTKPFFKADNANADRTWWQGARVAVFVGRWGNRGPVDRVSESIYQNVPWASSTVSSQVVGLRVDLHAARYKSTSCSHSLGLGAFLKFLLSRSSSGAEEQSYAFWLSVCGHLSNRRIVLLLHRWRRVRRDIWDKFSIFVSPIAPFLIFWIHRILFFLCTSILLFLSFWKKMITTFHMQILSVAIAVKSNSWRFLDLHHCQCVLTWSCRLLLTHRCVHSIASPLLCRQYKLRTQANSTYRTTRGQTFNSLCLPLVTRRSGELTPLYTSTLLYNNLPSELRSPNISFSLFHCTIMKYLGHPVRRP